MMQAHGSHGTRGVDRAGHSSGHQLALPQQHLVPHLLLTAPSWPPKVPHRTIPRPFLRPGSFKAGLKPPAPQPPPLHPHPGAETWLSPDH